MKNKKYIRLTKDHIKSVFEDCNQKYFGNKVETPDNIELWTPTKRCVGWVRATTNRKTGKIKTHLHISARYNWTEENLRDTIIHEMIHLEIKDYLIPLTFWQRILRKDHDKDFIERMNEINATFGLNISIRAKHMRKELKK